jgi:ferric-dicitrate binding protein FerR (iron transport regulator)
MKEQTMDRDPQAGTSPVEQPAAEPVMPSRPVARRSGSGRLLNVVLGAALVLAVGGVAFAVGRMTAPPSVTAGAFPGAGNGGQFPGNGGNRPGNGQGPGAFIGNGSITLEGTVESVSDTTLTLKTADGQTVQVALDGGTTYHAQTDASADDVTTGTRILVRVGGLGGPAASGSPNGLSASDVTVVP